VPDPIIKYAFVAGVLSPKFFGRTDLEKYDLGLAEGMNWFVDYQGGISTRPGLEFVDYTLFNDLATKFVPFRFAPNVANTYVVLFSNLACHFFQDGAPVVEAAVTGITGITQAATGVVTRAAHGLSSGDRVILSGIVGMTELNGQEVQVRNVTADTFELFLPIAVQTALSTSAYTAYVSGGQFERIYSIVTPYTAADLALLRAYQIRDTIRLTHPSYATRNLTRLAHTSWTLSVETIGNQNTRPSSLSLSASASGDASVGFAVTAIDVDGIESLASDMEIEDNIVNYPTTEGSVTLTWATMTNIKYFNVYRTIVLPESDTGSDADATITRAEELGYVGRSFAPRFVDPNIIPDFTRAPPQYTDPFAIGAIEQINVTNGGSGYPVTATVSASLGTGFSGFPIVDPSGTIIAVVVRKGGTGYTGTTISFAGGGGSGATAVAVVSPTTGTYPSISAISQQRQVYAASLNDPLTIWFSRAGYFSNFDVSQVVADKDAMDFDIDSEEVASILHLIDVQSGVLVMSQTGVWLLRGGEGEAITPSDAIADPQNYRGCSAVPPIKIDTDLLYVEGKGTTVRLLTNYSDLTKKYTGQDVSILSSHLFTPTNKIEAWAYASNPHNLIWAVRTDGKFLPFTLVKEQDVYAWSICETQGIVTDCCVVQENGVDSTYLAVRRYIGGTWRKYIERLTQRTFTQVEDAFCVDSGLATTHTYPAARLDMATATGSSVLFTTDASVFVLGDVGKVIRAGGGKGTIVGYNSGTSVNVNITRTITEVMPETGKPLQVKSGSWTMDATFSTIGGMWHLNGQSIYVLADGAVQGPLTVVDGRVSVTGSPSQAFAGLKYTCVARTLPPVADGAVIESRKKRPVGVAVRVYDTLGLKIGDTRAAADLYPTDDVGDVVLQTEQQLKVINAPFDVNGQVYLVQDNPLPATVIGLVTDLEVGDDQR
jgi:hypothetical protein